MRQSSALVLRAQLVSALNAVQARGAAPVGVPIVLPFDPQARTVVQPKGSSPPGTQTTGASGFPKRGAWLALAAALGLLVVSVIAVILYFKPKSAPNPGVETSPTRCLAGAHDQSSRNFDSASGYQSHCDHAGAYHSCHRHASNG